jgi:aldose sugar dehydrogenase
MAFLGPDHILVLEKNPGNVFRVLDDTLMKIPLLHVNAARQFIEWGLLGIPITKQAKTTEGDGSNQTHTYGFLYYTKSIANPRASDGNHTYRFELLNGRLTNPLDLLILPFNAPDPLVENNHNGGKVLIGVSLL